MQGSARWATGRGAAALLLCAAAGLARAASLPLDSVRVALPAELEQDGRRSTLLPRQRIGIGDTVVTGAKGRAAIQLAGLGTMTIGADSALYIHSAEPPDAGRGALLRIALLRGVLRLDATPHQGLPTQDFRLNAGRLQLRVYGAEVWVEISARGEDVCLLDGAVEIVAEGAQDRLDTPGSCLLFGPEGRRLRVQPDARETLARKLVRTAFAEDYVTRMAAERADSAPAGSAGEPAPDAPDAQAASQRQAAPEAAPSLRPVAPPVPIVAAAPAAGRSWTVVVASLADAASAEAEAARLRGAGLAAESHAVESNGVTRYRVTLGPLASRAEALKLAAQVKASHQLTKAWVTQY
ncbi:MAG TPA: SPOR domain-containing protein [Solimonas sp.]|nr:SPOR domain-containing protein [Solimonas sp.]